MAGSEENIEIKFRIFDGTDIAHRTYSISTTVSALKQMLVTEWPQDKSNAPKSVNELKLIHGGRVLESSKTLADYRIHLTDVSGGVITMHVVIQPLLDKKKSEKNNEVTSQISCSCAIL